MDNTAELEKLEGVRALIGNTPLLRIDYAYEGRQRCIFAKAEYMNYTGSIKDRMAYYILREACRSGELRPGMRIVEATSGNTGISFAALGRLLGHEVTIYMPDWMSVERMDMIRSFGGEIRLVSAEEGGFLGSIAMAEAEKRNDPEHVFLPRQFDNPKNCDAHYYMTGPEMAAQLDVFGVKPDAFVAGVGTGGTLMGMGRYVREMNANATVHPLEPANSPTLSTGYKVGKHRIQGISDEFIPSILQLDGVDDIVHVDDGDAIIMAQKLACSLGLGVGISSGGNFLGAVDIQNRFGDDTVVLTVLPDDNKKYLSTDYVREEPVTECCLSRNIELLGISAVRV